MKKRYEKPQLCFESFFLTEMLTDCDSHADTNRMDGDNCVVDLTGSYLGILFSGTNESCTTKVQSFEVPSMLYFGS